MSESFSSASRGTPAPAAPGLNRVSPKLATVRLILVAVPMLAVLIAVVVGSILLHSPTWLWISLCTVWIGVAVWITLIIRRQVPALGYLCRDDDLLIKRGILFRRTTLVPYGRLQFVEVSQGPIARPFGLASVQLHTAAALSDATIDGLPQQEAEHLRDHLAARGESQLAGL